MKKTSLTPAKLRLMLFGALVVILGVTCGVFYLGYQRLNTMAADVGAKVAEANDSQNTLQELQKLKSDLDKNQEVINNAARIAADSQNYAYQDQIVSDLTTYAARSGMSITDITFSGTPTGAASAPAAMGTSPAPASAAGPTPAGLKSTTISVTLKTPADYKGLLNFLHYIEQNLTKLKIASITLSKSEGDSVNTDVLNLEVYLR